MKLTIYTDGASRGNPGPAAYGFVIFSEKGEKICSLGKYIGINTNNFAEYSAVVEALRYLSKQKGKSNFSLKFFMDSRLVAEQLSGRFKIKSSTLKLLVEEVKALLLNFKSATFTHIPREKNYLADSMANKALDSRLN